MAKALTLDELKGRACQNNASIHVWVELVDLEAVYAGIVEPVDGVGVVGIWCAGNEKDWLRESTYGAEWRAYLEKPEVSDRYNFVGAHLNGME